MTSAGVIASQQLALFSVDEYENPEGEDFTKIVLQASFDGLANGATSAPDTSMYAHTITFNGTAAISTAQSKFGTSSLNGTHCEVAMDAMFGGFGGDFGVEFFFRMPNAASSETWALISCGNPDSDPPDFGYDGYSWRVTYTGSSGFGFNGLSFQWHKSGEGALNHSLNWQPNTLSNDTWYHFYAGRDNNLLQMFLDGTQVASVSNSDTFHAPDASQPLSWLGYATDSVTPNVFMNYLRLAKERTLYTGSSFTPPAAPPF